jgi:hypothetical protein
LSRASVDQVGKKTDFQRAQDTVAAYHESYLRELTAHVADAIDQYRAERIDAFDVEAIIHQYHQAASELWTFCWAGGGSHVRNAAQLIEHNAANGHVIDWWERGAPRRR